MVFKTNRPSIPRASRSQFLQTTCVGCVCLCRSIISLIANVSRSSEVMSEVFAVMKEAGVQVTLDFS